MARIRTIKPEFFTSEDVMSLSPLARLLFIGTWLEADREGRLTWKPATLKVRYLPSDACDVKALCDELTNRRLVMLYGDGLAFIPNFSKHQYINGKEATSKLPPPSEEDISRVHDASARVTDAPSLPSFPVHSRSFPDRPAVQGRGAFPPGSLPRDHKHHRLCGPSMRICLKEWEYNELARQYGEPDASKSLVVLVQFLEVLEKSVTPNDSIGPFNWVEKNFQLWMKSVGRAPAMLSKNGEKSINDQIDEWARS